jgi:O-antigen ligase
MLKKLINVLIIICIAITLLNSNSFGSKTLIASFGYHFFVSILGITFCIYAIFNSNHITFKLTSKIVCFWAFCFNVLLSSILTNNFQINSYYWLSNLIFFTVLYFHFQSSNTYRFHWFIMAIAALESLIVLLQFIKLFPVPSSYFLCTGTWINPNVIAMFLGVSIFSSLTIIKNEQSKVAKKIAETLLILICVAIALLKCRTAYIIVFIQLIPFYFSTIKNQITSVYKFNQNGIFILSLGFILFLATVNVFKQKTESTNNRISIWQNTIKLGLQKPLFGFGSSSFEKEYNIFSTTQNLKINDHINMAYNDFLEIFVELGIIGLILWLSFLTFILFKYLKAEDYSTNFWLVFAVVCLQLTNFGFQALPAFVLVLFYFATIQSEKQIIQNGEISLAGNTIFKGLFMIVFLFLSAYLFVNNNKVSWAFYVKSLKEKNLNLVDYVSLKKTLNNYPSYNKLLGQKYYFIGNYNQSKIAFTKALAYSSEPDLFIKRAYIYEKLNLIDSAINDYRVVIKMQPHKLSHKFVLLQLFQSTKDSINGSIIANEILNIPIKIKTKKAFFIKEYAKKYLKK